MAGLQKIFPRYPAGVYAGNWKDLTSVDLRTVKKMLEPDGAVRQASVATMFGDLDITFDEAVHLRQAIECEPDGGPTLKLQDLDVVAKDVARPSRGVPVGAASVVILLALACVLVIRHYRLPPTPTDLSASPGDATISLTWSAGVGAVGYNVYRGTTVDAESPKPIKAGLTSTSYLDTGLNNDQTYYYKVRAVNVYGMSDYSGEATAAPDRGGGGGRVELYDNFMTDSSLNSQLWSVNGPASTAALTNFASPPAAIVAPELSFTSDNGLEISGIGHDYHQTGIQSISNFRPPFTVTAACMSAASHAAPVELAVTTADGGAGIAIIDGQGGDESNTGFIDLSPRPPGVAWLQIGQLSPLAPDDGTPYTLAISVDADGKATVAASSGSWMLGKGAARIGSGPFHVVIAQGAGAQPVPGPNHGYCKAIQVTYGTAE